jgi:hypothetical protein
VNGPLHPALRIRHRFDFGVDRSLVGRELTIADWERLRTQTRGPFALPADRAELEARARAAEIVARAAVLDELLASPVVASYGAGSAALELALARLRPERVVRITEVGPCALATLERVFPEADAQLHDLRHDPPVAADVHLFHRIDTEFDDSDLAGVFRRFAACRLVVVPTEILTTKAVARELVNRFRTGMTDAGWVRSRGAFERLWADTHSAQYRSSGVVHAWALTPRSAG